MNEKYLVVFDTVALVQRVMTPAGNAAKCFAYFEESVIAVAVSRATLKELKDELPLNLAIEVNAHYLVSRDKDLLDLMDWNKPDGREFQRRFRSLKIVKPEAFLQVMESS